MNNLTTNFIGNVRISTARLVIDPTFGFEVPNFFETMVFGGEYDGEKTRYITEEQAIRGHGEMISKIVANMNFFEWYWSVIVGVVNRVLWELR